MHEWFDRARPDQWLPDTWTAYGWLRLYEDGAEDDARSCFHTATQHGVPLFSLGLRRLLSGLELMEPEAVSGETVISDDPDLTRANRLVT